MSRGNGSGPRFYEPDDSVTRWVQPFESVPEFKVEMRRLSEAETNRLYDQHKVFPGAPKQSMTKWSKLVKDLFSASIISWQGAEFVVGEKDKLECNDENRRRIASVVVEQEEEGEKVRTTLSSVLVDKFAELEGADAKN